MLLYIRRFALGGSPRLFHELLGPLPGIFKYRLCLDLQGLGLLLVVLGFQEFVLGIALGAAGFFQGPLAVDYDRLAAAAADK